MGPAELLESLGVNVAIDLPGVGNNFQDHPTLQPVYECECHPINSFHALVNRQVDTAPDVFSAWDIVGSTRDAVREEYLVNRTGLSH